MTSAARTKSALLLQGLPPDWVPDLVANVPVDAVGLLLYGSRARGDHRPESDFDLLFLVPEPRKSVRTGPLSISYYTERQLLSASRTLYGTHLIRDAKVLWDPTGQLRETLDRLKEADPESLIRRVLELSVVLDVTPSERKSHLAGLTKLARYLLRTATYARAMAEGTPCFSVRELATRFSDPELERLLASDPAVLGDATEREFEILVGRLEKTIGPLPKNRWRNLPSLVVEHWESDRVLAAVAMRTLTSDEAPLEYADLPKVVL